MRRSLRLDQTALTLSILLRNVDYVGLNREETTEKCSDVHWQSLASLRWKQLTLFEGR